MRLILEKRADRSPFFAIASPFLALLLTLIAGGLIFALRGINPLEGLYVYFVEPLTQLWSVEQLIVKAAPLVLIGVGLAVCYMANVWNIGAEGQLTMGAIAGSIAPVMFPDWQDPSILVVMLIMGAMGGALYGAIPGLLKTRFNANEILTSLMLVYVAALFLDWLVRGPWRDPQGFNFPVTKTFAGWQLLPTLGGTIHLGALFALLACVALAFVMGKTLVGFEIKVTGSAPRAGRFAGFSRNRMVMLCFLLSGGLAGLAGICEVASVVGKLQPQISPGYGFAAIIVAFLGRLNPLGVLFAGLLLALSYIGGEAAQVTLGISDKIAKVFQGILLFFILVLRHAHSLPDQTRDGPRGRAQGSGVGRWTKALQSMLTIITAATPLLIAAMGELVVERSGVLNLGVEGMMVMGAVAGFAVAFMTGSTLLGVGAAIFAGVAMSALFGFLTLTLVANQVAAGLALTLLGLGLSGLIGEAFVGQPGVKMPTLFGIDALVPFSLLLTAGVAYVLFRTKTGLVIRAVGNSHSSAHALGYRVIAHPLSQRDVRRGLCWACRGLPVACLYAAMDREHDGGTGLDRAGAGGLRLLAAPAHAGGRLSFRRSVHSGLCRPVHGAWHPVAIPFVAALYRDDHRAGDHFRKQAADAGQYTGLPCPIFCA